MTPVAMTQVALYRAVLSQLPQTMTEAVIAMGSNDDADRAFLLAIQALETLGQMTMSQTIVSPDFTQKTNHIYHNACVRLILKVPLSFFELKTALKNIESHCGRSFDSSCVAMDLDILAVSYLPYQWHISQKRLPFKNHEILGLGQIAPFLLERQTQTLTTFTK